MRLLRVLSFLMLVCVQAAPVWAQGLAGPSSVESVIEPGDGLTDPQFRSDFPQRIVPGWFAWKDQIAENGVRLGVDYLSLGQWSNSPLGTGEGSGGIARVFGTIDAGQGHSFVFKLEDRHRYGAVAPQFLGLDGGALAITGTAFNGNGTMLTNLFWNYRDPGGGFTLQLGQIDVTDFLDVYGLVSPYSAFQNLAFNTNPTINAPNPGLGIAGGVRLGANVYAVASVADANADPTAPDLTVFSQGNLFKSLELGYTSGFDRIYFDNLHLTIWHGDAADDGSRAEDYGAAFSAAWFVGNQWMPFFRAGVAEGTAALYQRSVSAGLGYYGRNTDLAGLGINWSEAKDIPGDQTTLEAFYRFSVSPGLQITPSLQYIVNPLLTADADDIALFGLRARIAF